MEFKKELFISEINELISKGVENFKEEKDLIYTMSLCIDVNSQYSSIHFDTKEASDEFCGPNQRNFSPADFKYGDYVSCDNRSFEENWEYNSEGTCWDELKPIMDKVCEDIIQNKINLLKPHKDFMLTCSGPNDWCEFEYLPK